MACVRLRPTDEKASERYCCVLLAKLFKICINKRHNT